MTVENPVFPECPSCDHDVLGGIETVGRVVTTDGEGGAEEIETPDDDVETWQSLWCERCGKILIREGEWIVDPDDGSPRIANGGGHRTFDEYE